MTHDPGRIARVGGLVIDAAISALIVGAIFCAAKAIVDRCRPERIVVPDYHESLARQR